jgi:hypothetical protein
MLLERNLRNQYTSWLFFVHDEDYLIYKKIAEKIVIEIRTALIARIFIWTL